MVFEFELEAQNGVGIGRASDSDAVTDLLPRSGLGHSTAVLTNPPQADYEVIVRRFFVST